ncbi:ABC transporter permease, partial [Roseburia faecis]
MTWPFENDTSAITKKLAKKSLQSEKRRNLMVVIAVALAAFLICFTGIVSTSLTQMQRNQVVDTYEAVWLGVEENDIETLKGLPEFERVGGYYMLGEELSEQGYHASYVYCDTQMMEITKAQMELLEGRVPEKANEIVVSKYFLSTYGNNAKIGDTVTLDTESFHGDYVVTGIMNSVNEKEANTCAIILSKAALTEWNGFDPAGYRAYAHFKNSDQLGEELMTSYCREIAEEYQLPMPKMNSKYFAYASKSFDFALMAGVIALVLIGGYIVIQSIFRISINDKIQSYGQLRTIGATPKQIKRIVKNEGRKL